MLKYHVAVCDDEKSDLDGIVQSVQQYDVQGCFDIETYMDGNELLSELQMQKKSFDLLLLDIEMPSNGFQLAQSLIQMEKHPLVVFVTKRHEYAVQGYGIAFRYLVKPLDQTLFAPNSLAFVHTLCTTRKEKSTYIRPYKMTCHPNGLSWSQVWFPIR